MEATPSTWLLGRGLVGGGLKFNQVIVRFYPWPSQRLYPASCKMRQRSSLQNKRQQAKKINLERPTNTNVPPNSDNDTGTSNLSGDSTIESNQETASNDHEAIITEAEYSNETDYNSSSPPNEVRSLQNDTGPSSLSRDDSIIDSNQETASKDHEAIMIKAEYSNEIDCNSSPPNEVRSLQNDSVDSGRESSNSDDENSTNIDGGEQLAGIHLQDLIGMIRQAEKNINLLNQARIRAVEDLEKILSDKEELQGQINTLEMKLAETDSRLKVAAQEKIRVELLEDQLEKLRNELSSRGSSEEYTQDKNNFLSSSQIDSFSQELDLLRAENLSLKDELQFLKVELGNLRGTDQRIQMLEEERSLLESSLKELASRFAASHEDISNVSSLKSECNSLYEKVEDLQTMMDKATKQADQAILVLQQNQELRKKVDQLEESLNEAGAYRLSAEKMQQYNELMQQKIRLLDERLQRSDEEIQSYVQLYQDSMKEFQDTLDNLKEESKKRGQKSQDTPVNDKPAAFWSSLLLTVDGWFLEKKISVDQVKLFREMIWNREGSICDAYMSSKEKNEREIIETFLKLISSSTGERLHVIHIAAEMAPVAKVGGLGDVVTGLSKALQKKGHLVEIVLPKYDCMQYELIRDLKVLDASVDSYFDGHLFKNKIWVGTVEGLPVYFIEPHHPSKFFWRGQYYGEQDDFKRFSFFSRAALELLLQSGKKPDIIHCHDWQTSFIAPLYWDLYVSKGLNSAKICFTCHNFEYQGAAPASNLGSCGLDVSHLNRPDRMQDHSANDRVNPVKGAIVFSNIVTTVSPSYAQEVRTAEGGRGLHATLNSHSKKFVGILNGIDTDAWNPATDQFLESQYNFNDIEGKAENKEALRRLLGISSANLRQPLVACITRLVPQKGVHLIRHAIYRTLELGGQFVLLGSSPVPQIQREFEAIDNHFKTHQHARLILKYDETLAHLIYAASDMFIIPSIFEPCGLTQMIAMRYGAIPIVRKTGGLNDSVFDVDDDTVPVQYRNGFTFLAADEQAFGCALERAFNHYMHDPDGWKQLVQKDMSIDFSWESSSSLYEELYAKSVARARIAR